ncbi:GH25 family lysozyme [Heyndrickxia coagulans]|uniref:GH25 family lysozyme n=1 Tax=Heyndrickxia coagulans TaxID=1398 RepID=UPI0014528B5E|nr:GH25 family lysozyme [Heyndrickxia coagulans]MED4492987.1 GH25 family lysozyme [Heyndrickxia coagulans]MED4536330.1 GH25 family lysozyme [Heyndrickxia coagulans]QJE31799.1 LysM peptidoglycan-binding domain-containing protein [Heyndrickxia coagulans]
MKGFDIYHGSGNVNFKRAHDAGYRIAMVKATEGKTFKDPKFIANVKAAKSAGFKVGAYHFARFTSPAVARQEARFFYNVVKGYLKYMDEPLVLDLETNHAGSQLVASMQAFFSELKKLTGHRLMLYSMGYFYLSNLKGHHPGIPLWYARYASSPIGVHSYYLWQKSQSGKVPGISAYVDINETGPDYPSTLQAEVKKAAPTAKVATTVKRAVKTTPYYVTASKLNIRKSPGGEILGQLSHGDRVQVLGISAGWAKIKSNDKAVYVSAKYLTKSQSATKAVKKAAPKPVYHKVVRGDTVGALAKKYGSTLKQIKSWNKLDSKYTIYVGKKIRVK